MAQAGMSTETFTPDSLIASGDPISESITLEQGQNLKRGSLIGKVTVGEISESHQGNTGNGEITFAAIQPGSQPGVYSVVCITEKHEGGTFRITDPKGYVLGDIEVGQNFSNQIAFSISAPTVDFVAQDSFSVTVAPGSGEWRLSDGNRVDGSQVPRAILAQDTDATDRAEITACYRAGIFNGNAMTFGPGYTADIVRESLRDSGIHLVSSVTA